MKGVAGEAGWSALFFEIVLVLFLALFGFGLYVRLRCIDSASLGLMPLLVSLLTLIASSIICWVGLYPTASGLSTTVKSILGGVVSLLAAAALLLCDAYERALERKESLRKVRADAIRSLVRLEQLDFEQGRTGHRTRALQPPSRASCAACSRLSVSPRSSLKGLGSYLAPPAFTEMLDPGTTPNIVKSEIKRRRNSASAKVRLFLPSPPTFYLPRPAFSHFRRSPPL